MGKTIESIIFDLYKLTEDSKVVSNNLSVRLQDIQRWIHKKKPGLIKSKKHLMQFLDELITFTDTWLKIQALEEEDKNSIFNLLPESERYWYEYLFPQWINEKDPKIQIWKQKLLDGSFTGSDAPRIKKIRENLEYYGGNSFSPYIADLSMATDIIAATNKGMPFCVQITTLNIVKTLDKQNEWLKTLSHWRINRGLFISFNPTLPDVNEKIARCVVIHSDLNQNICYCVVNIDR
ncbi:hypothetical protein [Anabaena azotica]|uniref:Uncharacterized protein n=1 Tax=Anabaena azotica FACHB-119 TaxID=947527 RepID=A0ABR8DE91_9NOST|nr:hypothetical protein [Anabaena azotica]MBD2504517.1 hypothetical protein [Anabaena azotica FACHB-119]